ncbi:MAG: glycoside hydrolase family 3 C-terminal domain-containing protein [Prevotella sp.]|nr:glycoside hydrolase family 3 C-terminal domain-containing protein [Prevotella sp.]
MKTFKHLCTILLASTGLALHAQPAPQAFRSDPQIEEKIERTLRKMTLEEKIGQMTELTIEAIQDKKVKDRFAISEPLLDSVITKYKVGSILNVPGGVAQPRQVWQEVIAKIQRKSLKGLGIPCVYGVDQIHGTTYTLDGTLFPQGVNMGATFNRRLVHDASAVSAYETRAASIPWVYAPVLDLGRDPRWPRMWENFGEDCYLNAEMGRESVLGFQGNDPNHIGPKNVGACLKHFMGYGVPASGKDRTPSHISQQEMREKHFAPFLESIRNGHALSVMVNSQSNSGMPLHANAEYLTGWLKNELGWDGMIVTDWADINNLWKRDHIAKDKKDAIRIAINAGIDMSMDPYDWDFCPLLQQLVTEGKVSMQRIDDACRRVLRLKYRLNLFDQPYGNWKDYPECGSKRHTDLALEAAGQSMVLLKNKDGILPLAPGKRILVTGPNSNSLRSLNGGWTTTWQGKDTDRFYAERMTILEAFRQRFGAAIVVYEPGVSYNEDGKWHEEQKPEIEKAVSAAASCDVIVACIGENSYCETPGNLDDLALSANQRNLVKALSKTGKPIILILNQGRPRLINDIEPLSKAVINAMLPGNYGGEALARLVSGDANFSGKQPFTYPKHPASLTNYDYKPCEQVETMSGVYDYNAVVSVQWAFGYGLSYTSFRYSNLRVDRPQFKADDTLTFSVDVTNTGRRSGMESVLLFASDLVASLTPDNRRLRAFEKTALEPGETKTVTLRIKGSDLAFVGYDGHWTLEEGDFRIQTGDQVLTVSCTEDHRWAVPNR